MKIKLHCSKTLTLLAASCSLSVASAWASVIRLRDFDPMTFAFGSGSMAITGRFDDAAYASFYGEGSHPRPVSLQRTAARLSSLAFLRK